jgi:protoporphyrinogen oxidase
MNNRIAIIIGAGPAGLTAAYELVTRTDIKPIVIEKSTYMGGIARTVNYKGNRIDIGGHRFFSKSDRVMNWWAMFMPVSSTESEVQIAYQGKQTSVSSLQTNTGDKVMLVRERKSRIYYMRKLFDYPITLTFDTLSKLGLIKLIKIGITYLKAKILPQRKELNLEDFFINRFGSELYKTFFKSYTEKVWGVACNLISPEWGAQRVKGLSLTKAVIDALKKFLRIKDSSIDQKGTETTLIEKFLYPKLGPG